MDSARGHCQHSSDACHAAAPRWCTSHATASLSTEARHLTAACRKKPKLWSGATALVRAVACEGRHTPVTEV